MGTSDRDLERLAERRVQDEEALKSKLPPPQNAKEQKAARGVRDVDMEEDN